MKPRNILVHLGLGCDGDMTTHIAEHVTCHGDMQSQSIFGNSFPSDFEGVTFKIGLCMGDPFCVIPMLNAANGYYSKDFF